MKPLKTGSKRIVVNVWSDEARAASAAARASSASEDPIAATWRKQAAKMSDKKLQAVIPNARKFANAVPNDADKLRDKIVTEEMKRRGVKPMVGHVIRVVHGSVSHHGDNNTFGSDAHSVMPFHTAEEAQAHIDKTPGLKSNPTLKRFVSIQKVHQ